MKKGKPMDINDIITRLKNEASFDLPKDAKIYQFSKTNKDSVNFIEKEIEKIFEEVKIKFP